MEEIDPLLFLPDSSSSVPTTLLEHLILYGGHFELYNKFGLSESLGSHHAAEQVLLRAISDQNDNQAFQQVLDLGLNPRRIKLLSLGSSEYAADYIKSIIVNGHSGLINYHHRRSGLGMIYYYEDFLRQHVEYTYDIDVWCCYRQYYKEADENSFHMYCFMPMMDLSVAERIVEPHRTELSDRSMFGFLRMLAMANNHTIFKFLHQHFKQGGLPLDDDWRQSMDNILLTVPEDMHHPKGVAYRHQILVANGRSCSLKGVIENDRLDVLKELHHWCNCPGIFTNAMDRAAELGKLDIVKWLHENRTEGCTTDAMDLAASNGYLNVVKYLHENRNEGCTTAAMDSAAGKGFLDVVKWLHENRTEGCTTRAMDDAAELGCLPVVKYLQRNRSEGCSLEGLTRVLVWRDHGSMIGMIKFLLDCFAGRFDVEREIYGRIDGLDHRVAGFLHLNGSRYRLRGLGRGMERLGLEGDS
ncbi:hypothetical protein HDU76_000652 [Blyttiomyces sp. JEL0837]|nr:hypothetical protein HDU76_000652 [Blyttiomyces sp. JEL0837]